MSLARKAVQGAAWTISSSIGSRAVGLVGTLVLTRFVTPTEYGEVMIAAVLVLSAQQLSTLGVGQYLVAHPGAGNKAAFHSTVYHVALGAVALVALLGAGPHLGALVDAPGAAAFLPGLVVAGAIDRVVFVPERLLVRDLRFSALSAVRTLGEISYAASSVGLVMAGWGPMAVVGGNVIRSILRAILLVAAVRPRDWLEPCPPSLHESRKLLGFGVPIWAASLAAFASRRWDNLLVSGFFGPAAAGAYNLAYNLADVPAMQVGEQIGDVLLPSFARMDRKRRALALLHSLALLGLVVFPLAVGLGAVAPTLVALVFDERWQAVAPMLLVLSALSVTRPVGWTVAAYLQAQRRPRTVLVLEVFKLFALVGAIMSMGRTSPLSTCFAVGAAYALHTIACLFAVWRVDGVPMLHLLGSVVTPLVPCVPMALAVVLARWVITPFANPDGVLSLVVQVTLGALTYVASALVVAPTASKDLLARVRDALPDWVRPRNEATAK